MSNIGRREFARLMTAAHVKRITFHGLRHTSATLLLSAGEAIHVVSQRLGHKNPMVTMSVYAHVLPGQQQAAARLEALLHGSTSG
jgi:integrase